jgi:hypothetical protein
MSKTMLASAAGPINASEYAADAHVSDWETDLEGVLTRVVPRMGADTLVLGLGLWDEFTDESAPFLERIFRAGTASVCPPDSRGRCYWKTTASRIKCPQQQKRCATPPEQRTRYHSCDDLPRRLAKERGWRVYDVAEASRAVPAEGYVDEVHFRYVLFLKTVLAKAGFKSLGTFSNGLCGIASHKW